MFERKSFPERIAICHNNIADFTNFVMNCKFIICIHISNRYIGHFVFYSIDVIYYIIFAQIPSQHNLITYS